MFALATACLVFFAWHWQKSHQTPGAVQSASVVSQVPATAQNRVPTSVPQAAPVMTPFGSIEQKSPPLQTLLQSDNLTEADLERIRAEVKTQLASAFTAQKAFHAENERYTTDLVALGIELKQPALDFKMGFLMEARSPETSGAPHDASLEDPTRLTTDNLIGDPFPGSSEGLAYTTRAESIDLQKFRAFCRRGCTADEKEFEMLLAKPLGNGRVDVWLINSDKDMELVHDGRTDLN